MFSLNDSNRFYLYTEPTDMRKSFYSLSGIVKDKMGFNIFDGDAFIFINKGLNSIKVLHMESGGLVIYYMKLERGCIQLPDMTSWEDKPSARTSWTDLIMMVEGISLSDCKRAKRWCPETSLQTAENQSK